MELPGYNTMQPYPHMNERCPSLPTKYSRTKNCQQQSTILSFYSWADCFTRLFLPIDLELFMTFQINNLCCLYPFDLIKKVQQTHHCIYPHNHSLDDSCNLDYISSQIKDYVNRWMYIIQYMFLVVHLYLSSKYLVHQHSNESYCTVICESCTFVVYSNYAVHIYYYSIIVLHAYPFEFALLFPSKS